MKLTKLLAMLSFVLAPLNYAFAADPVPAPTTSCAEIQAYVKASFFEKIEHSLVSSSISISEETKWGKI